MVYFFLAVFAGSSVNGQVRTGGILANPGLDVGLYQGHTQYADQGLDFFFRLYNKSYLNADRYNSLSLSSGLISGLGYRNQLNTIDYRRGYSLSRLGLEQPKFLGKQTIVYAFGGLGMLYNRPLEVVAPDDPLTLQMGSSLPVTSFWKFEGGFVPVVPVGLDFDLRLDPATKLNIALTYNRTIKALKLNDHPVPKGFWALSMGLNFNKTPRQPRPQFKIVAPQPIPFIVKAQPAAPISVVETASLRERRLNKIAINFDVLSNVLDQNELQWVEEAAVIMKLDPALHLELYGHADSTGNQLVNEMISESRARAVALALVEQGIDLDRMTLNWFADDRPLRSNRTSQGRFENRRVEFSIIEKPEAVVNRNINREPYVSSLFTGFEYGQVLPNIEDLRFDTVLELDEYSNMMIELVAYLMMNEEEMQIAVLTQSDPGTGSDFKEALEKARSEVIKDRLIRFGIAPDRIKALAPGSDAYTEYKNQFTRTTEQTLLIPLLRVGNETGNSR